jgi:hypothetical protein
MEDDVPKKQSRRLQEIVDLQQKHAGCALNNLLGKS